MWIVRFVVGECALILKGNLIAIERRIDEGHDTLLLVPFVCRDVVRIEPKMRELYPLFVSLFDNNTKNAKEMANTLYPNHLKLLDFQAPAVRSWIYRDRKYCKSLHGTDVVKVKSYKPNEVRYKQIGYTNKSKRKAYLYKKDSGELITYIYVKTNYKLLVW